MAVQYLSNFNWGVTLFGPSTGPKDVHGQDAPSLIVGGSKVITAGNCRQTVFKIVNYESHNI